MHIRVLVPLEAEMEDLEEFLRGRIGEKLHPLTVEVEYAPLFELHRFLDERGVNVVFLVVKGGQECLVAPVVDRLLERENVHVFHASYDDAPSRIEELADFIEKTVLR